MAVLTLQQYQQLRTRVVGVADTELQGRKVIYQPSGIDKGVQDYGYDKLADMSAAEIIGKYSEGSKDIIDLTRKSATVPIMHKGFKVSRIDLASSKRAGESIKAIGLSRATRKVAELEDDIIVNGNSAFGVSGIEDIYGNTVAGTLDWGTGTLTDANNPYTDCSNVAALIEADGFDIEFLLMHPTNYREAAKKITGSDGTWLDMIKKNVTPNILKTTAVTEGGVYGGDMGEDIAELIIPENFELLDPNVEGQMVYDFDVITRSLPVFFEYGAVTDKSDAFAKLTGI